VTTTLYCPGCRKRCGDAKLLDVDVVHVTTSNVVRRGRSGLPVHVTRGRTLRLSDPDGWPLRWRCGECDDVVQLGPDTAVRIGSAPRILCSMSGDN
jgi:hypothetical protein